MNEFSKQNKNELKIIALENGAFHKAEKLKIPENIILVFLPPYSPELNPAERIWQIIKQDFTNKLFNTLDELSEFIKCQTQSLTKNIIISACAYSYIFSSIDWAI